MSAECLAIIPARGGSKGVPRKNLREVAGRPLIAHSIAAALTAERVTRVVVSTDDDEISAVARVHGAEVVRRPAEISGDTATSESALVHCLEELDRSEGYRPELVMLVQCTSPLTAPADMDGTVRTLLEGGADSCFTAVPFHHFVWKRDDAGHAVGVNHRGAKRARRQDLQPELLENGAVYVMRAEAFLRTQERFCGVTLIHEVSPQRALEVDDLHELELADVLLRRQRAQGALPDDVRALILDFDGVLTDNRVMVSQDGTEAVLCNRGDGMGLGLLAAAGVELLILSKERNPVVGARARKLSIECLQAVDDKPAALRKWLADRDIPSENSVFAGNDVNDVECMKLVGGSACPSDAHPSAMAVASLVLQNAGGHGAVRELCDLILSRRAQGQTKG